MTNEQLPIISIIVPVWNGDEFIIKCIESIVDSSYQNIQIICIDDGSSDSTNVQLMPFVMHDDRVVLVSKKNEWISVARNFGIDMSIGEYIAFIDADDWIHKDYFAQLMLHMGQADIIACQIEQILDGNKEQLSFSKAERVRVFTPEEALKTRHLFTYTTGRIYHSDVVNEHRFNESVYSSEDVLFNHAVIPECHEIKLINHTLYYRRVRKNSLSHTQGVAEKIPALCEFVGMAVNSKCFEKQYIARAYKMALRYRYVFGINKDNPYYDDFIRIATTLKEHVSKLSTRERIFFRYMMRHPRTFGLLYEIRNHVKRLGR